MRSLYRNPIPPFLPRAVPSVSSVSCVYRCQRLITAKDHASVSVVLECVPAPVAAAATSALHIPTIGIDAGPLCSGQHEKIMSNPRGGRLIVRFHRLTEAARSAIAVPPMASADGRTSTTGSKRLGLMANVAKRKQSFLQFFLMTGVFMLSMRSLSQKYRIRDLSDENALLRKERDAIALRSSAVKEALFQEAALDPSGLIAHHVRSLFDEKPDH